jgi:hypothetical protein
VINFLIDYSVCHAMGDASWAFLLLGAIDIRGDLCPNPLWLRQNSCRIINALI